MKLFDLLETFDTTRFFYVKYAIDRVIDLARDGGSREEWEAARARCYRAASRAASSVVTCRPEFYLIAERRAFAAESAAARAADFIKNEAS